MGLEELLSLDIVQTYPARHRLVDVLSGLSIDDRWSAIRQRYKVIKLDKGVTPDGDDFSTFVGVILRLIIVCLGGLNPSWRG